LHAHLGLAEIFRGRGDPARAQRHIDRAYAKPRVWRFPCRSDARSLRVLVLVSAAGGDLVINRYLDDREVEATVLLADSVRRPVALPDHDLVLNAIGDADRCEPSLERAQAICAGVTVPVINDPVAVARTGRVEVMRRLRGLRGVRVPRTERVARAALTAAGLAERGFTFPLLLRSPGHHAGMHFERVDDAGALDAVAAALPGDALIAIEYLDLRAADGNLRKYRAVIVDGRIYPAHLAIAKQWKVHYFSAAMSGSAAYRAEEAAFLADMSVVAGTGGMRALAAIGDELGLDYAGVDFGIDRDGSIVVFEANATMAVYPPSGEAMWAYRRAPGERIVQAVRTMLRARATSGVA
jgi:glutathione synthase/RimK-type ligase-like ATP-grasp enzyme